jgi:hypothetical protein
MGKKIRKFWLNSTGKNSIVIYFSFTPGNVNKQFVLYLFKILILF